MLDITHSGLVTVLLSKELTLKMLFFFMNGELVVRVVNLDSIELFKESQLVEKRLLVEDLFTHLHNIVPLSMDLVLEVLFSGGKSSFALKLIFLNFFGRKKSVFVKPELL